MMSRWHADCFACAYMKTTNLKPLVNSPDASPLSDRTAGKGPVLRTSQRPLNRFADAPALVAIREQLRPDKTAAAKADTGSKPKRGQGPHSGDEHTSRPTPDGSHFIVSVNSLSQPTAAPAKVKADVAAGASALPWSSQGRKEPTGVKTHAGGRTSGAVDMGVVAAGRAGMRQTAHILPAGAPQVAGGGPANVTVRAVGGIEVARPDNAGPKASKPVPADVLRQAPQKSPVSAGVNTTRIVPTELRPAGQGGQATARRQSVENPQYPRTANHVVAKSEAANMPVAPVTASAARRTLTLQTPGQVSAVTASASQSRGIKMPGKSERDAQGVPLENQPRATPKRPGVPGGQDSKTEAVPSGGKEIPSGKHIEGANGPAPGTAHPAIQTVTVAPPVSNEAQTHALSDFASAGSPVRNVGEQILESVQASMTQGDTQIVVRLQPPGLGTVVVRFREQDSHLEGILEVRQSETRHEIERALPDVIRGLQDAGIPIRKFDVTAGETPEQSLDRGLSEQDGWSGQHGSGQNRDRLPGSPTPWSGAVADYAIDSPEGLGPARQLDTPQGGIDVLL